VERLALILFICYAVLAFGLRTIIHLRRTGNSGFRGLSGRPGTLEWFAGVLFVLALVAGFFGPVAGLIDLGVIPGTDHAWLHRGGAVIAVIGMVATFFTQAAMGNSWRIGVDADEHTALVTTGPFRFVRNPIFTAMLATGAGIALMVPNLISVFGWLGLFIAVEFQVRYVEEPYLAAHHGRDYHHYAETTGRFLPGIGRRHPSR
jgi:protein-S-isoprenylcysteine O-methyltransferase Ste14